MDQGERTALIRRAHELARQHQEHVKRAAMMLDAESRWIKTLNKNDRQNRDYVLLALKSDKVPSQLGWSWSGFDRTCSMALKTDREIFLQRLELDDFEKYHGNRVYRVPGVFRNDKEVMLKLVSKSSLALSFASKELQNDREVVMAALRNRQPCAPQTIKYASKKLRGDRRIVRTVLRHGHGIKALKLLPRKLQEDYDLVLLAVKSSSPECNESYETLSELSDEMLAEADIVHEAVKRRGSNLRFVECLVLLEDPVIIKAACKNDGKALEYCPESPVRDNMLKGSNLKMILRNGGCMALNEKDDNYWCDPEYFLAAVEGGMWFSNAEFLSELYKNDRPLFMDVLRLSDFPFDQYEAIPIEIQRDPSIGLAILRTNQSIGKFKLAHHLSTDISDDKALCKHMKTLMKFAAQGHAIPGGELWTDKAIVVSLCKFNGDYLQHAYTPLVSDPDVLRAAFSGPVSSGTIYRVPLTVFEQHHDIVAMAVKFCRDSNPNHWRSPQWKMYRRLGAGIVTQPQVMLEWARRGWYITWGAPHSVVYCNEAVALEALKHCGEASWKIELLRRRLPNKKLQGDKAFMLSAIEANPIALKLARCSLLRDYDFMLRVVSSGRESLMHIRHQGKEFDALAACAAHVRSKLAVTGGFVIQFLGAIAIDPPETNRSKRRRTCRGPEKRCHLRMLDFGSETAESIKRTIAEFADVPIGPELKILHSALDTLQFWGY